MAAPLGVVHQQPRQRRTTSTRRAIRRSRRLVPPQGSLPLLANFKIDNQRNQLRTLAIQRQISDINAAQRRREHQGQRALVVLEPRAAIEAIEIQNARARPRQEVARRQPDEGRDRHARADRHDELRVAGRQREQGLLAAQIAWTTAELNFKRLIVSGTDDDLYRMTINPVDAPELHGRRAWTFRRPSRTRSGARGHRLGAQATSTGQPAEPRGHEEPTMPTLNLTGSYQVAGQGGPTVRSESTCPIGDGGYCDALRGIGSLNTPTWTVGFTSTTRSA